MSDFDPRSGQNRRGDERDDEHNIGRVLRAAGGRASPSDEMKAAVRAAVHTEWRATVEQRNQRRVWFAAAASVLVVALALWGARLCFAGPTQFVADVSRSIGTVQVRGGLLSTWHTAMEIHSGERLKTGPDGRVALRLRDGVSLRLDHDTRIAFVDAGHIDIEAGAVYVDSGVSPSAAEHLRVGTPAGVVQHIGTQYEARIVSTGTRLRVREGRVNLTPEHGATQSATVGEQLLVSAAGGIERAAIAPSDPQWDWAESAAPPFDIDGKPVRDFLTWIGREMGREVVFANPNAEAEANRAVLSGSVVGLTPSEALVAVLPTTALRSVERDGKIEISLQ